MGVPFGERGRRFDEAVALLGLALAGGPFEYHGVHFDTGGSVQATGDAVPLPVVFGGNSELALRRAAARVLDGWFASGTPPFADAVALTRPPARAEAQHGPHQPVPVLDARRRR